MLRLAAWAAAALLISTAGAPGQDGAKPVTRIVFGSCADQNKPCPVWGRMADQRPDLTVLLGDNIYADLEDGKLKPATPDKIARCYAELGKVTDWQRLRAAAPVLATWDDHDYGHNDAGAEWGHKDEAQRLFLDFLGVPADSPRRRQKGVYSAATFGPEGKRVQVILLDTRYHRSPLKVGPPLPTVKKPYVPNTDAGATVLGEDQWKWLEAQLRQPADLRLIGSSIQVVPDEHVFEKWANVPAERDRLYRLIRETKANGVIVLSGDRHHGELSVDPSAVGYPLYDLTGSGLNQAAKDWRAPERNRYRVAGMPYGDHFGVVAVDWAGDKTTVSLQLRDAAGEVVLRHAVPLKELRAKADAKPTAGLPAGVIGPEEALRRVGQEVSVQFAVKNAAAPRGGKVLLLNSQKNYRSEANFTVAVYSEALTGRYEGATVDAFKGKVVRATGKVVEFQKRPQLQVRDAAAIEVVGDAKE